MSVLVRVLVDVVIGTRYLPVPLQPPERPGPAAPVAGGGEANFTQVEGFIRPRGGFEAGIPQATWLGLVFYLVLLGLLVVIIAAYVALYRGGGVAEAREGLVLRVGGEGARRLSVGYRYEGVGVILYRVYSWARRVVGCRSCSPRELSERVGSASEFADVYEEAVYGRRRVPEAAVQRVVEKLRRALAGSPTGG